MLDISRGVGVRPRMMQPYFMLSTGSAYSVMPIKNSSISHFYSFIADRSTGEVLAVPDASIEVLFLCDGQQSRARVCGTTTSAKLVEIEAGKRYFGVRFKPGYIPNFIGYDSKSLVDAEVSICDILKDSDQLLEQIITSENFEAQVSSFLMYFKQDSVEKDRSLAWKIHELIMLSEGNILVSDLEKNSGYTSRYISKSFSESFGIPPKMYALIVRFQSILHCMIQNQQNNLTELSLDHGYADQSHFLREFKRFAAQAPSHFLQRFSESKSQKFYDSL